MMAERPSGSGSAATRAHRPSNILTRDDESAKQIEATRAGQDYAPELEGLDNLDFGEEGEALEATVNADASAERLRKARRLGTPQWDAKTQAMLDAIGPETEGE